MRTKPDGLSDGDLVDRLWLCWDLRIVRLEYVPVGGGSHHWLAQDAAGTRHWVTVDVLDNKEYLVDTPAEAFDALQSAFETALALRAAGLEFVVAPRRSTRGKAVERLDARHAVAVFPFVDGSSRAFEARLPPDEREQVVDMLVRLHQATTAVAAVARPWRLVVPSRSGLEDALDKLDQKWAGGPFSEPARAAIASHATAIRSLLATFDRLADEVAAAGPQLVITHGEPHPGNFVRIRTDGRLLMVDWDTASLGPPERDLWMLSAETGDALTRYTDRSGRQVDQTAIQLYRVRWLLDDISASTRSFRSAHDATADTEHAWLGLTRSMASPDLGESAAH